MGEAGHEMGEAKYCGLAPPPAVMCSCVRCGIPSLCFCLRREGLERPRERGDVRANDQADVIDLEAEWREGKSSRKSSVGGSRVEYISE